MSPERITNQKEIETKEAGYIIVITGKTGAGKDSAIEMLREKMNLQMVVSFADRPKRENEEEGVHHYFVTREQLQQKATNNELIEPLNDYGSNKATPKSEIMKVKNGHTIWRIDPRTALQVATGQFFHGKFSDEESEIINRNRCVIIFIDAPNEHLYNRWKLRDGEAFAPEDYAKRLAIDEEALASGREIYDHIIENPNGALDETVEKIIAIINGL